VHVRVQAACGQLAVALPARAPPAGAAAQRSALPALEAGALATPAFQTADAWDRDSSGCWEADGSEDSTTDSLEALVAQLVGPPTHGTTQTFFQCLLQARMSPSAANPLLLESPGAWVRQVSGRSDEHPAFTARTLTRFSMPCQPSAFTLGT